MRIYSRSKKKLKSVSWQVKAISIRNRFVAQKSVMIFLYSKQVSYMVPMPPGKSNLIKAVSLLQKIALGGVPKNELEPF